VDDLARHVDDARVRRNLRRAGRPDGLDDGAAEDDDGYCTAADGFNCVNAAQPDSKCDDYEVRFACTPDSLWTPWLNRDDPGGNGDGEHLSAFLAEDYPVCAHPVGVQCRRTVDKMDWTRTGERLACTPSGGAVCLNADQTDGACDDYEVRFVCPTDVVWTSWMNRDDPSGD
jgi:hypothetical protein